MKYEERAAFEQADAFGIGAPNDAYAQYFCRRFLFASADRSKRMSGLYGECHI